MKKSMPTVEIERMPSGIANLDAVLRGGLVKGSMTVLAGSPGAGKTTFAHQICFHNASKEKRALIFQTLSEPAAKTMRYMSQFEFFEASKMSDAVEFVDLGATLRANGMASAIEFMMKHIKRVKPSLVVIDSFKVFEDLAENRSELRKFTYEVAVQLMAWEITGFLLGEYTIHDIESSPLFSVVDGIISMRNSSEKTDDRVLKVIKMRGTAHERNELAFDITNEGIVVRKPQKAKR